MGGIKTSVAKGILLILFAILLAIYMILFTKIDKQIIIFRGGGGGGGKKRST